MDEVSHAVLCQLEKLLVPVRRDQEWQRIERRILLVESYEDFLSSELVAGLVRTQLS